MSTERAHGVVDLVERLPDPVSEFESDVAFVCHKTSRLDIRAAFLLIPSTGSITI